MNWFYNLKISRKLIISFLTVSLLSLIIAWIGLGKIKTIAEQDKFMYEHCVVTIQDLGLALAKYELANAIFRDQVNGANQETVNSLTVKRNNISKEIGGLLKDYEGRIVRPEEKALYDEYLVFRKQFKDAAGKCDKLLSEGKIKEAKVVVENEVLPIGVNYREKIYALIKYNINDAQKISDMNTLRSSDAVSGMLLTGILGLLVSIGLGFAVSRIISKPINKLTEISTAVANGNFDFTISSDRNDETGILAKAFSNLTDTIRMLNDEVHHLVKSAVEGKLSVRGNSDNFNGNYKKIVMGINDLLDSVIGPLNVAAEYVDRIAKGDIPPVITDKYNGDFNELKNNLNLCIASLNALTNEMTSISKLQKEGDIEAFADEKKFQGVYKELISGYNSGMQIHISSILTMLDRLKEYSEGSLQREMPPLPGKQIIATNIINQLRQNVLNLITDADMLAVAAVNGKLDTRADVSIHSGDFRKIMQGVNNTLDAVINPLTVAANYVDRIAKGDIPEKITDNYNGQFNEIKINLNLLIDAMTSVTEISTEISKGNLNNKIVLRSKEDKLMIALQDMTNSLQNVISDIFSLAEASVAGNLGKRANAQKHEGDFRRIVEGVNNTLDAVVTPLNAAAGYIEQIKNGSLSEPITETFNGDFNEIKNNLNDLIATTTIIFKGVNRVITNVNSGFLDDRGNPALVSGNWQNLIIGINGIIDSLVKPIRFMADNITKISVGDIPVKITDDYQGEFNQVKENLNTCFSSINALIEDMTMLAESAVEGNLDKRANAAKHKGDYAKIIIGVNNTLDSVLTPIKEGVSVLEKMSDGDLTIRITSHYKGNHELIKNSINSVADSLSVALKDVSEAVAATASASNQISSSTEEMAAGASEQTQQTTEIAGAVEEMTRTVLENTKNVMLASDTAKEAGKKAKEGGHAVKETISGMNKISEVVKNSANTVQALGKSSDQIGEIIQVIDDIADQTNLLALNAAIEAARAGEQGRGFAVVADEVRKLAERTTKATKEIADMIKQIQKDTKQAVESMQIGTREVESGKLLANNAGESLEDIIIRTEKVVDIITQVAAASEQQSSSAEEISRSIEAISTVTQESASGTHQIAHAAEDLNRLTLNLENLISQFKIDSGHSIKKIGTGK